MTPDLSVKRHHCIVSAYAKLLHLVSLVGVRESVRAVLSGMQHGHSAVLKGDETTTLVNFGYQSVKVIQSRLPSGAFHAIAMGERIMQGDILILKDIAPLAERFYRALFDKSTLQPQAEAPHRAGKSRESQGPPRAGVRPKH